MLSSYLVSKISIFETGVYTIRYSNPRGKDTKLFTIGNGNLTFIFKTNANMFTKKRGIDTQLLGEDRETR